MFHKTVCLPGRRNHLGRIETRGCKAYNGETLMPYGWYSQHPVQLDSSRKAFPAMANGRRAALGDNGVWASAWITYHTSSLYDGTESIWHHINRYMRHVFRLENMESHMRLHPNHWPVTKYKGYQFVNADEQVGVLGTDPMCSEQLDMLGHTQKETNKQTNEGRIQEFFKERFRVLEKAVPDELSDFQAKTKPATGIGPRNSGVKFWLLLQTKLMWWNVRVQTHRLKF